MIYKLPNWKTVKAKGCLCCNNTFTLSASASAHNLADRNPCKIFFHSTLGYLSYIQNHFKVFFTYIRQFYFSHSRDAVVGPG